MQQEIASTREHLQAIIAEREETNAELRAANEEILSSNEELQSTNEELETAKQELQAANEELYTVNEELQNKNLELSEVNDDLHNLLSGLDLPILMLGSDLRIRRFNAAAEKVMNVISTDVGRPLNNLKPKINVPDLEQLILEVCQTVSIREREVQDQQGRWYHLRIRPSQTAESKVEGAVVVLVDIDALKRSREQLEEATEGGR